MNIGTLQLTTPAVMGVLNVTPDSFSDGGRYNSIDAAKRHAEAMHRAGAAIIDVGGESTRPGAMPVSTSEELDRIAPVVEAIVDCTGAIVSIDTSNAVVMREAVSRGAGIINDVRALQEPGALQAAADLNVPVCLMHMQGSPETMQEDPHYVDIVAEVSEFLAQRVAKCVAAGISESQIVIDPGFGFGKTDEQNLSLLANLHHLKILGKPLLVGLSRKSTLGAITGRDVDERTAAGLAAAVVAALKGASIVRTHDVGQTIDALRITTKVLEAQ